MEEVLLGGNDEHGDAHRFGNTSQKNNDIPTQLVACFDTNLAMLKKIDIKSETKQPVQRCTVKIIIIDIEKRTKQMNILINVDEGKREKNRGTKE